MTTKFNVAVADRWPTKPGFNPAKRSPLCELYERTLALVISVYLEQDVDADVSAEDGFSEHVAATLQQVAAHVYEHRGVNINHLDEPEWDTLTMRIFDAVDIALIRGAGPYELSASTNGLAELVSERGIECLAELLTNTCPEPAVRNDSP